MQLPKEEWFVPLGCMDCYKIVVRPRTYDQLLKLEEAQTELGFASKCGVEIRPAVKGLYGGYFYNRGLDEARKKLKTIKRAYDLIVREADPFYEGIDIIIKRGCTEFEHAIGPSDQWQTTGRQLEVDAEINKRIYWPNDPLPPSQKEIDATHDIWVQFAYKYDPTYDGEPLYPPAVVYE
jgi:hypothetical protein